MGNFLIVGLGNPGKSYEKTRHNIGFEVVRLFAAKHRFEPFRSKVKYKGSVSQGVFAGSSLTLLLPETYMNLSGEAVALCLRYLKVELSSLLVIVDDVAIPFGQLRMKPSGTPGGHNGLKSIEDSLMTQLYPRLRVGVNAPGDENLADYVLSNFSKNEEMLLPEILGRAVRAIEVWLECGIVRAMDFANAKEPSNPSNGE